MTTYNGGRFIRAQIESVLSQLGPEDEVVIGDDRSIDDTVGYLTSIGDERLKVTINSRRLGHVRNFESCLARCKGEIIIFCDHDDIWMPEKVSWTKEVFEKHPSLTLVHHGLDLIDEQGRRLGRIYTPKKPGLQNAWSFLSRHLYQAEIFGSAAAIRGSSLSFILPFPTSVYAHDHWMAIVHGVCGRILLSDALLICYRQHNANLTPKVSVGWLKRIGWRAALTKQLLTAISRSKRF